MYKRVIIIHGCPSDAEKAKNPETRTYDKHWIPWLKKEFVERGIQTETPLMPTTWEPDYEKFKVEFEKCVERKFEIFHQALGGEAVELKKHGHYTMNDMGTEEFPELLEIVLK